MNRLVGLQPSLLAGLQVELGDYVEVDTDEGLTWVVEILELFQTTEVHTMTSL